MNWTYKKIFPSLIIICVALILLEVCSAVLLKFYEPKSGQVQTQFMFKKTSEDGQIVPTKNYVLPVLENANFKWDSKEFSVTVATNSKGLREDFEITNKDVRIAFFGDSFTMGHGVEAVERYSNVFARNFKTGYENKTVSFSYKNGFQPEHYEYFIRNNGDLKPEHVVIGLYLGNDLGSDLRETIYDPVTNHLELPYRRILDYGQMGSAPEIYKWPLNHLVDLSNFAKFLVKSVGKTHYRKYILKDGDAGPNMSNEISLELGMDDLRNNRGVKSILRINKIVNARGGILTVVIIPQNYFFGATNPHINSKLKNKVSEVRDGRNILVAFKEVCQIYKLSCFDASTVLQLDDYLNEDAHWNPSGHRKVGLSLAKYLE